MLNACAAADKDRWLRLLQPEPSLVVAGPVELAAHALALPIADVGARRRHDAQVEEIAMRVAKAHAETSGSTVHDVSRPEPTRRTGLGDWPGFDPLSITPTGGRRAVAVKGRAHTGDIFAAEPDPPERRSNMGATHVTVTIRNPADPERAWEGLFLVDTGATDSLVPRPHLESICLWPRGRRVCELADGSEITMDFTVGEIEFMGETVGGTILFGETDAEPLLGVTALESVGIEVDPDNQRLKRLPAVRLKSLR